MGDLALKRNAYVHSYVTIYAGQMFLVRHRFDSSGGSLECRIERFPINELKVHHRAVLHLFGEIVLFLRDSLGKPSSIHASPKKQRELQGGPKQRIVRHHLEPTDGMPPFLRPTPDE
jgi:hypothetical protein